MLEFSRRASAKKMANFGFLSIKVTKCILISILAVLYTELGSLKLYAKFHENVLLFEKVMKKKHAKNVRSVTKKRDIF